MTADMEGDLKELKSVLKSLVVSSPTQVDVRSLVRDYRDMVGTPLPLRKYGYRDATTFLQERCSDCFLFQGPSNNPVLTLIVPDNLKHIDQFVQKQRITPAAKFKGKRRSVPESIVRPPEKNLITKSFGMRTLKKSTTTNLPKNDESEKKSEEPINGQSKFNNKHDTSTSEIPGNNHVEVTENNVLSKYLAQRLHNSMCLDSLDTLTNEAESLKDNDSSRHTLSSTSEGSARGRHLEELKAELKSLVTEHPDGVWCTSLLKLYRERYNRELNYQRFGFTSLLSLACVLDEALRLERPPGAGDWLLVDARRPPREAPRAPLRRYTPVADAVPINPEDALPGIAFDPDVFPTDCVHQLESIPRLGTAGVAPGAVLEVTVGEVYSPSHFWLQRLGDAYNIAMEEMMDEMNEYYIRGAGHMRWLASGACLVGSYCASLFDGDWHRALIVKVLDFETVKVRHVDYGTVERVARRALKPLLRRWAELPAQAMRARLAGVRPSAAGHGWPHAVASHFLSLVADKRLVASVVAVDHEEEILEVLLINTSTSEDVCISTEMIRGGYADPRADAALKTGDSYLLPKFAQLEEALTLNYAEIHCCLRDGIQLDFVDEYRNYVPCGSALPATLAQSSPLVLEHEPELEPEPESEPEPEPKSESEPEPEPESRPAVENVSALAATSVDVANRVPLQMTSAAHARMSPPPTPRAPCPRAPLPPVTPVRMAPLQSLGPQFPSSFSPPPMFYAMGPAPMPYAQPHTPYVPPFPTPLYPLPTPHYAPRTPPSTAQHAGQTPLPTAQYAARMPSQYGPRTPPPPYNGAGAAQLTGETERRVSLSVSECEVYQVLCRVEPAIAHRYMTETISRALSSVPADKQLNEQASELRSTAAQTDRPPAVLPPPGLSP